MAFLKEYTSLGSLGSGGFAEVFKVRHNQLGYVRAIRVLNQIVESEDSQLYNKFIKECKVLLRLGNGNLKATSGVTDQVIIPVANTTDAGVVTIDKQTFAGAKTFNALITAKLGLTSDENISTAKQLISTIENGTAPLVVSSKTLVTNLNADTVDGLHASNNLFNAENSSTTILPTQRAIWSSLNDLLVAAHALVYRGIIDPADSKTHPTAGKVGDVYIISKEGTFAGVYCEPGDMAIYYASGWDIVQVNVNGAVVIKDGGAYNSAHATTNAIPRFEDTTGRVIKNSKVIIDDTGNITPVDKNTQNLGSTENIWNTIYGSTFTGTSKQAISDDSGQVIKNTYIKEIAYIQNNSEKSNSKSKPYLKYLLGKGTDPIYLSIPLAGAQQGGIITAESQEISGVKTLNADDGGLIIPKADSFQYSGVQKDTATGTTKYIWFSSVDDSLPKIKGIPKYNTGLAFNPSCVDSWGSYDNGTVTAYKVITTDRFKGLSFQALQDDQGQVIKNFYLQDVVLNTSASAPYYTLKLGNGLFKDTDGTSGADKVIIPVASTTQAGVITADTSNAQTITGAKIIDSNGSLEVKKAEGFNYSGIQTASAAGARSVWFSHLNYSGTPCINNSFKFNPEETLNIANWSNEKSGTKSSVLHVPHIDGLAYKALRDSQGLVIDDTYIKTIEFIVDNNTQAGSVSNPYLKYTLGNGVDITKIALPAASASQGGILNTDAQEIKGKKTFNDSIATKLISTDANTTHYLWFSTVNATTGIGTPAYSTGLTYNASTGILTSTTFKGALDGLATKATSDAKGQNIADTYIKEITYSDYKFTIKLGNGLSPTNSPLAPLFAASGSCGGDALKAVRWSNAVTIQLTGEVTGSASIVGNEGTITIATSLANTNLSTLNGKYLRKDQADSTSYTLTLNNTTDLNSTLTTAQGALIVKGGVHIAKQLYASKVYNAVWNDYAECRKAETLEPGRVVIEDASGEMKLSSERLQPGGSIISDTYGHSMGYTDECQTPVAVAGRVLSYYDGDIDMYTVGAAVGTGPNGTVSLMTREEIMTYPDRIIGIVSEIPSYEEWGPEHIKVNGRIWIKIK